MTTEIAIVNRLGVALATDSFVTITGEGRTKVFDTADKLFELSDTRPVGIMINGNMDCMGVPWEILIKDFRSEQGSDPRDSLETWMTDFLEFVESHPAISDAAVHQHLLYVVDDVIESVQSFVVNKLWSTPSKRRRSPTDAAIGALIMQGLQDFALDYESAPVADSLSGFAPAQIRGEYEAAIRERLAQKFPPQPHALTAEEAEGFVALIVRLLLCQATSDAATGVVVAGYGRQDDFPSVFGVTVDGRILGKLKYFRTVSRAPDDARVLGKVISFAQTDVIERLLRGADPKYVINTADFIEEAIARVGVQIEQALRGSKRPPAKARQILIAEVAKVVANEYENTFAGRLSDEFGEEFERTISLMPKQELIELAEALVSITAIERKASTEEATVGGPIDVALITKHEGFVWIKRKHYFNRDLNPRFFWRKFGHAAPGGA